MRLNATRSLVLVAAAAFAGCAKQPAFTKPPENIYVAPFSLMDGWMIEVRGSVPQPMCLATRGAAASGAVVVQFGRADFRPSSPINVQIAVAFGRQMQQRIGTSELLLGLGTSDQRFLLQRTVGEPAMARASEGASLVAATNGAASDQLRAQLPRSTAALAAIRRDASSDQTVVQRFSLPNMPRVLRALEACLNAPTNTAAIRAAAGLSGAQRSAPQQPTSVATEALPAPPAPEAGAAGPAAAPAWLVPPPSVRASPPPPASPLEAAPAWLAPPPAGGAATATPTVEPTPSWAAPPRNAEAAPTWLAPPPSAPAVRPQTDGEAPRAP